MGKLSNGDTDQIAGHGARSETLLAAAELERRKHESNKRLDRLEQERKALVEILDGLVSEEKIVGGQLAAAQDEHERIARKIEELSRRVMETEGRIDECQREIAVLDRGYSGSQAREKRLDDEIASAETMLGRERNEIFFATEELKMGRAALERMDQRLSVNRMRR